MICKPSVIRSLLVKHVKLSSIEKRNKYNNAFVLGARVVGFYFVEFHIATKRTGNWEFYITTKETNNVEFYIVEFYIANKETDNGWRGIPSTSTYTACTSPHRLDEGDRLNDVRVSSCMLFTSEGVALFYSVTRLWEFSQFLGILDMNWDDFWVFRKFPKPTEVWEF